MIHVNVFYEEDGGFKVGHVMAENDASYQVEAAHGKRSKIKAANVLLKFERPALAEFLPLAEAEAAELDLDFLWEVAPKDEFGADGMANEYYGRAPAPVESAALIMRLHGAPMYFHKKGRGRYKAAPEDALKAALASVERKKREAELQARYVAQLVRFDVPDELRAQTAQLLYAPDKQSIGFKALESACAQLALTPQVLLHRAGALASAYDFYLGQFLHEHFPERLGGRGFPAIDLEEALLPRVSGQQPLLSASDNGPAFSIDDSSTTEIDDALSVKHVRDGVTRVGIHIAAPGLGFAPGSPIDAIARRRMSTVYMPGDKITMLPDAVVERFTLMAGRAMPVVSLYLDVNENDGNVIATRSVVDTIAIAANLRHDVLDEEVTQANLESGGGDFPFKPELQFLWRFANAQEKVRGKPSVAAGMRDFSFKVDWPDAAGDVAIGKTHGSAHGATPDAPSAAPALPGIAGPRVTITERKRGAPLDKIVSELMILANSTWGKLLADQGAAGIYRVKTGVGIQGKVRMTSAPAPHIGLGVTHYAWSSSPLRRYVDLVNQWQLIAVLTKREGDEAAPPPFAAKSESLLGAIAAFDTAYTAYAEFQDTMERYWCLKWLEQHGTVVARVDVAQGDAASNAASPAMPEAKPAAATAPAAGAAGAGSRGNADAEVTTKLLGTVMRDGIVRLDELPLRLNVAGLPGLAQGARVAVQIRAVDEWRLWIDAAFAGVIDEPAAADEADLAASAAVAGAAPGAVKGAATGTSIIDATAEDDEVTD